MQDYENENNDDEDDDDNELEMSLNRIDSIYNKKKQVKQQSNVSSSNVVRRGESGGSFKSQLRPKQTIQRYHSFQNRFRVKEGKYATNDGYADDVEDNGDDESSISSCSRRAKIYSLQSPVTFNCKNELLKTENKSIKQSLLKPINSDTNKTTSGQSGFKPSNIILKSIQKPNEDKNTTTTAKSSTQNQNKMQVISTLVDINPPKLSNYSMEDNNSINLAFVKLIKRKRQPEVASIYDNVEGGKSIIKCEVESDDSLFNANSTINSKINNQMITSTSTFSTNSSNQSSPALFNKIQNNQAISTTDSESQLPKIYINEDLNDEQQFIDNKSERRDSGVGRSLTREIKLTGFSKLDISVMNVVKFSDLKPLALVKITALMEEYCQTCQKSGWNRLRSVPKFIKRHQRSLNENDIKNKNVFGVPFKINIQRHGTPLPLAITHLMEYIRRNSPFTEGVFRKPGLKKRTQEIRDELENNSGNLLIENYMNNKGNEFCEVEAKSSNDVINAADVFKQYFRELPECLLTNKLSQTLIDIFTCKNYLL